jgi:hypothetical protein
MIAKAWCNGNNHYGIRVGKPNRCQYFQKEWKFIEVEIDGRVHNFRLTDSFWRKCPEFRDRGSPVIREWLIQNNLHIWDKGKPPKVNLIPMDECKFRLEL